MLMIDFTRPPHSPASPFQERWQAEFRLSSGYTAYVQQFGSCWGYVIFGMYGSVIGARCSPDWDAPMALKCLNEMLAVLEIVI